MGDEDDGPNWTKIGTIVGIVALVVAVITLFVSHADATSPKQADATSTTTATPTVVPTITPPATSTSAPSASTQHNSVVASDPPPVNTDITNFTIDPFTDGQTGPNQFSTGGSPDHHLMVNFTVQDDSGDIRTCTITAKMTPIDNSANTEPTEHANCPSHTFFTQWYLKPGRYRLDATVYVPDTQKTAKASYPFSITK